MQWKKHYEVGIPQIDKQHREWIRRIELVKGSINTNRIHHELGQALKYMVEYTQLHFEAEENYLWEHNYVHLDHHKQLHAKLIGDLTQNLKKLKQGRHLLPSQLIDLMSNWVLNHILFEDKKYCALLKKR